jgi:hypothetical protein
MTAVSTEIGNDAIETSAATYFKITVIDLARKRLAAAQKRQESGVF